MQLTLIYRGALPARRRGVSDIKHGIRAQLHQQIHDQIAPRVKRHHISSYLETRVDGHLFWSAAHARMGTAAELDIMLLTPSRDSPWGDLDNRMKTLLDGLTRPANPGQLQGFQPSGYGAEWCLLDDDNLITKLNVDARQTFGHAPGDSEVVAVITATLRLVPNATGALPTANTMLLL